jgi:hypothetical protein
MQTLGLSESTPRTESRWRALFRPTIRNEADFDYVTRQGFWICLLVAVGSLIFSALAGLWLLGALEFSVYFLAATGVRERSRSAAIAAFTV